MTILIKEVTLMDFKSKIYFIMFSIITSGMLISSGCAKKVSTTQIGEPAKPEVEVSQPLSPAVSPEVVSEPSIPKVEAVEEVALKEEPVKEMPQLQTRLKAIDDIYFDFDRYLIRDDSRVTLLDNADILKKKSFKRLVIEGHCDERGTTDYNIALGERRAEATRRYIASLGIDSSKVSIISYGKERPFCAGRNEDCWQQNRRAHFVVTE